MHRAPKVNTWGLNHVTLAMVCKSAVTLLICACHPMTCMTWEHSAQCFGFLLWKLIFKSNYIKSVLHLMLPLLEHPGHYKGSPRFPSFLSLIFLSIVHHIIPLISMVRCINLFASSGVMIWCLGAIDSSLFATSLKMLSLSTVLPMFPAFKLSNKGNTKCCILAASLKWFRANAWLISFRRPTTKAVVGPSWSPAGTGATGGSSSCSSNSARSSIVSSVSWPAAVPWFCCRTTWRKRCCPITHDAMRFPDSCWYIFFNTEPGTKFGGITLLRSFETWVKTKQK